jgi:hypothetical protein
MVNSGFIKGIRWTFSGKIRRIHAVDALGIHCTHSVTHRHQYPHRKSQNPPYNYQGSTPTDNHCITVLCIAWLLSTYKVPHRQSLFYLQPQTVTVLFIATDSHCSIYSHRQSLFYLQPQTVTVLFIAYQVAVVRKAAEEGPSTQPKNGH